MKQHTVLKKLLSILPPRQKANFLLILLILALSAVLSQVTPLAVGYLTDSVLTSDAITLTSVLPVLSLILVVNVVNEVIKVIRRLIVEDTATQTEKIARQKAACSLLAAPLSYFRQHMTGNIHGRLNRSLEGTVTLEQVKEAARKANIAGEIEKLPGGYEFMLSEGGEESLRRTAAADCPGPDFLEAAPDSHSGRGHLCPGQHLGETDSAGD